MVVQCWPSVADAGPTLNQHWLSVLDTYVLIQSQRARMSEPEGGGGHVITAKVTEAGVTGPPTIDKVLNF